MTQTQEPFSMPRSRTATLPESGKTYKCTMKLKDEKTLDVRGAMASAR